MTVAANYRDDYLGTGALADYDFTFEITAKSELSVRQRDIATGIETTLVLDTDFTIPDADVNIAGGGTITLTAGVLAAGQRLSLRRVLPITQETDLRNQGAYQAEDVEDAFDRGIKIAQQHQDEIDRSLKLPESELPASSVVIPAKELRASSFLAFDANGDPIAATAVTGTPVTPFMATMLDDLSAAAAIATLLGADPATARSTLGGVIPSVLNLAALKALTGTNLAGYVFMAGYATAGDGGGGLWRWVAADAATANDGTIVTPTAGGGRFYRVFSGLYDVRWFGATGDGVTDDSVGIQAAITAASTAGGGTILVPKGTYLVSEINLLSKVSLQGVGSASVFKMKAAAQWCMSVNSVAQGDATVANNKRDIALRDLKLLSTCDTDGFSEFKHLLNVNACSDLLVERCWLEGFRGDGIYLGSGNNGGDERHNENIVVRSCRFDGLNKENRNAISVIDCNGLLVEACYFTRCSKTTMPGAIDIEPNNDAFAITRNITIRANRFYNVGGNSGSVCSLIQNQAFLTTKAQHWLIEGNEFVSCTSDAVAMQVAVTPAETDEPHDIIVRDNYVYACGDGITWQNVKGLRVLNNHVESISSNSDWGWSTAGFQSLDVDVIGNRFYKCGYGGASGIVHSIHQHKRLRIERNLWTDCGKSDGSIGIILDFSTGSPTDITIEANRVHCPTAPTRTTLLIQKEAAATLTGSGNRLDWVDRGGIAAPTTANFPHTKSGEILTGTVVADIASIASGAKATQDVTVTGAALEDFVQVSVNTDLLGLSVTAYVQSANTVRIVLANNTGGAVDLTNTDFDVLVRKK